MFSDLYFSGDRLYGDDLSPEMIEQWYADESEGYANLTVDESQFPHYVYHALNRLHGFAHLPRRRFPRALGFGSAYGEEFAPIVDRIDNLTILDPSEKFVRTEIYGTPARYVKPESSGKMKFDNAEFDLCLCLGALHHVPNITYIVGELFRCLAPGGIALVREPIVSMGDWRTPRRGLTKHERGIPLTLFRELITGAGFDIQVETRCVFPLVTALGARLGLETFNHISLTYLDRLLCALTVANTVYHRTTPLSKIGPTNVYYVLGKPMTALKNKL